MAHSADDSRRYAFVTLLTTDSYLPGALVLAHSLRRAHSLAHNPVGTLTPVDIANLGPTGLSNQFDVDKKVDLVCLVTPATVSVKSVKALVRAFDKVVGVEPLSFAGLASAQINEGTGRGGGKAKESKEAKRARQYSRKMLALLGRPDLGESAGAALTKLHAWRLTGYDKVVFLDADILVLRPLAHLFSNTSSLAASPDIGWPDAFNSGLLVLTPSLSTFSDIRDFAISRGSWDGADQGLLNDYFGGDEASGEAGRGGGWQRLPFRYNVTPNAGYMFAPAYGRYGRGIMTAHFIGQHKPWNRNRPSSRSSSSSAKQGGSPADYDSLLLQWHETYEDYYPAAAAKQGLSAQPNVVYSEKGVEVVEQPFRVPTYRAVWDAESDLAALGPGEMSTSTGARKAVLRTKGVRNRSSASSLIRGAGQAEDLMQMFHGDVVAASVAAEVAALSRDINKLPHEGVYISLPLDGRTSLMGVELDSGAEQESPDSDETVDASKWTTAAQAQSGMQLAAQSDAIGDGEWSPPKVSWDPTREPPPVGGGSSEYQMRTPVDAYYVNAWDQAGQPKGKSAFFEASNRNASQGKTMARLQKEHYFDNLGSDRPDPSLVKAVFPWEREAGVSRSSRIFPDEDPVSVVPGSKRLDASLEAGSLSPGETISAGHSTALGAGSTASNSSTTTGGHPAFSPSANPLKGLPPSLNYTNAWDQVGAIGAKHEHKNQGGNSRGVQTTTGEGRASRSSQTQAAKYRHRSAQADEGLARQGASVDHQQGSGGSSVGNHRQHGSGGTSSGLAQGLRDVSADQSADGDNESSSSSSSEGEDASPHRTGGKWRREGPGPGYQRKVERHYEQSGTSPRSPRSYHFASGGGGSRGEAHDSAIVRSRSSSGASSNNTPHPAVPTGMTATTGRQRLRPDAGVQQYTGEEGMTRSLDMSLSTAYEGAYEHHGSQRGFQAMHLYQRTTPTSSRPNSAHNSGSSSPTTVLTPLSQSPVDSRGNLRQIARVHAQAAPRRRPFL